MRMPSMAASGKAGRRAADYGGAEAAGREPQGAGVSGRSAWSSRGHLWAAAGPPAVVRGHWCAAMVRRPRGTTTRRPRGATARKPLPQARRSGAADVGADALAKAKADSLSAPITAARSTGLCAADRMCVCIVQSARAAHSGCHGVRRRWSGAMVGITNLVDAGEEEAGERHLPLHRR